ncbi:hypothetical protein [Pseudoxanthomonas sp.]|uniref:hypothetical protein n=1 Tax=Pseudoxanthomonas sp. TaxID=1871049 RepID=UPI00261F6292|nr:hypothetical protein [Pseudoxanthomonas sp.]WDS37729.1 MAG: hypothetical protein O8I58_07630 [Pseudoxanthomonas sp.]
MSSPETTQAASVAFSATVASALARSIRDTPLRPQAEALAASAAEIVVTPPVEDAQEAV